MMNREDELTSSENFGGGGGAQSASIEAERCAYESAANIERAAVLLGLSIDEVYSGVHRASKGDTLMSYWCRVDLADALAVMESAAVVLQAALAAARAAYTALEEGRGAE